MRKVLLSCFALAAGTAMAMAQGIPEYPESLNFTLNGEKELKGVSVSHTMVPYEGTKYLKYEITGKSNANVITMDFETPDGWDYPLIALIIDGEGSPFNTRSGESKHWYPVKDVTSMGYKRGNSFNFPVNGKDIYATIYLVKEDKVWEYSIDIEFNVSKAEGSGDVPPGTEDPDIPESLNVTVINDDGLEISQYKEEGALTLSIKGTTDDEEVNVILDVPEGWDGFISTPYDDGIEIGESSFNPRNTRAQEIYWYPIEDLIEDGFIKGNRFTFKPNGKEQDVATYLYKGDDADMLNWISIEVNITKIESGVDYVDTQNSARYYDLHGNVTSASQAGVYVRIGADGRVSKIMVK